MLLLLSTVALNHHLRRIAILVGIIIVWGLVIARWCSPIVVAGIIAAGSVHPIIVHCSTIGPILIVPNDSTK